MKLVRVFFKCLLLVVIVNIIAGSKTSSKAKMMSAEKLLNEIKQFHEHADSFSKGNPLGISQDMLEKESRELDLKYNDLLQFFIEKNTEEMKGKYINQKIYICYARYGHLEFKFKMRGNRSLFQRVTDNKKNNHHLKDFRK